MLVRYRDLLSLRIDTRDGAAHTVADVLVDEKLRLAYIVAEFRGWFSEERAVVRASDFDAPDIGAGAWPARLGRDDLQAAPAPTDRTADRAGAAALRAAGLGDAACMVGPGLFADADEAAQDLHSVGKLAGARVVAPDGDAGHAIDFIFDFDARRIGAVVVETGRNAPEHQRVVPLDMMAAIDWTTPKFTLKCPAERLKDSPELHELPLDGKWWTTVLSYYGI